MNKKAMLLALAVYCMIAMLAFGDILSPIGLVFRSDRLGAPFWPVLVALGAALGAVVFLPKPSGLIGPSFRLPVFVSVTMIFSLLSVGFYADKIRRERMLEFKPDAQFQNSFYKSLHEAPRDFQTYLHAGAMKDCVPYAWSYRSMDFYRVPANAAINVLPSTWLEMCQIDRRSL